MDKAIDKRDTAISFKAILRKPATPKGAGWAFLVLPQAASAQLPTRGMVTVDGVLGAAAFTVTLEPDGDGSHWLKLPKALLGKAGVAAGEQVALRIAPVAKEPEPKLPADFRQALAAHPEAKATWQDITAAARRDWIFWISSGKKAETRVKRIGVAIDKLTCGQRRACCFDRSGMYSKGAMGPPPAAE